jgi:hypothetical protein
MLDTHQGNRREMGASLAYRCTEAMLAKHGSEAPIATRI